MTTKTKAVASLAALLVLALAIAAWPPAPGSATGPTGTAEAVAPATAALDAKAPEPGQPPAEVPQRDPIHAPPASIATTGSLVVHVRYADEPSIASGVAVYIYLRDERNDWTRSVTPRAVTDDTGTARFHELRPGPVSVYTAATPWTSQHPTIVAGNESKCTIELGGGMTLLGIVVDPLGVGVGGAILEASLPRFGTTIASPGVTAADGSFSLRQCATDCLIGARAPGLAASRLHFVHGKAGSTQHVRIELLPNGGNVAGRVVGPDGSPVANAMVRVGSGRTEALPESAHLTESVPAQVETDANGRFLAFGVPAGEQPVQAQAAGLAPWRGTTDVVAATTVQVAISLAQGYTCSGFVKDENGGPLAGVRVELAREKDESFARVASRSDADGSFTVVGVPAGEATLSASHRDHGSGSVHVNGAPGQVIACDVVVCQGIVVRGRVVDDLGAPVAKVTVGFEAQGAPPWQALTLTDAEGKFAANLCPPDRLLVARITTEQHVPLVRRGIDPRAGQVELKLMRDTAPRARIVGRVRLADGKPAAGETVSAFCMDVVRVAERTVDPDGGFVVEVPSGTWTLMVAANAHAVFRSERRRLEPGGTWDVGTMQLDRGGTVCVADGEGPARSHRIITPNGELAADLSPVRPQRSKLLNAGDYLLLVRGENVAAQAIPFTIRSGEETVVDVKRIAGVRQRFLFAVADATTNITSLEVRADGRLVTKRDGEFDTVWLAPGSYTLHVRKGGATTTVPFTVAASEGPPVRVELQ